MTGAVRTTGRLVLTRRRLLADLGRVSLGAVVYGTAIVGCSNSAGSNAPGPASTGEQGGTGPERAPTEPATGGPSTTAAANPTWARVDLGFVSAYVVARAGEVAIVDTGVAGSEDEIERVLSDLGARWSDVGHVILTHRHPDHAGSVEAVLEAAQEATGYAGADDIPAIASPRPITPVGNGDTVMDLEVIATPGHTAGHICVLDSAGSVLFAGDALNGGDDGTVAGPDPGFTEDMETAWESVRSLGTRTFDTAVFGHGEPAEGKASAQVADLRP